MTYKKTDIISFWKRIAACMFSILILMMMVLQTSPSLSANAFYGNRSAFNSVTLTGNPADDIVNIAVAQKGKTTSQLSYTGYAWCVMFVCDCARIASELVGFASFTTPVSVTLSPVAALNCVARILIIST